jgi:hypothetical protein
MTLSTENKLRGTSTAPPDLGHVLAVLAHRLPASTTDGRHVLTIDANALTTLSSSRSRFLSRKLVRCPLSMRSPAPGARNRDSLCAVQQGKTTFQFLTHYHSYVRPALLPECCVLFRSPANCRPQLSRIPSP